MRHSTNDLVTVCRRSAHGDKCLEFTGDVGAGGLVDHFGDALSGDLGEAPSDFGGCSGEGGLWDRFPTACGPRRDVGVIEVDQVLIVDSQMPFVSRGLANGVEPDVAGG